MRIKELIADVPVQFLPRPAGDPLGGAADTARMKKVLGWCPRVKFDTGLSTYVAWLKENIDLIPKFDLERAS
jgi:UDP-glucose 4-epimerase/dTDP-L-rhamnose 4-epimerase